MTTNFYVEEDRADPHLKKTNSNNGLFSKQVNKGKEQQKF